MGVDAGGLYRDWFGRVTRELLDVKLGERGSVSLLVKSKCLIEHAIASVVGLFVETDEVDGVRHLRLSETTAALAMNERQVDECYRFAGRLIALALRDQLPLCASLAPPLCRLLFTAMHQSPRQLGEPQLLVELSSALEPDDVRYISMGLFSTCVDSTLAPSAREANLRSGGLTFATESRELLAQLAERGAGGSPKLHGTARRSLSTLVANAN